MATMLKVLILLVGIAYAVGLIPFIWSIVLMAKIGSRAADARASGVPAPKSPVLGLSIAALLLTLLLPVLGPVIGLILMIVAQVRFSKN